METKSALALVQKQNVEIELGPIFVLLEEIKNTNIQENDYFKMT